jgi:1-acyl-sn-glycerol-3-phosphate acyltransferase
MMVAWGRIIMAIVGCPVEVKGVENIPKEGGLCFISNHGSFLDVPLVMAYAHRQIGFIAKKEFAFVPLLDLWILMIGGLFVDRKDVRKAIKTIEGGVKRIKSGASILIFPEGHRSRGLGLMDFHPGSFRLATHSLAPVVPVAITGSYDVYERNGWAEKAPVTLTFCPPIDTAAIPKEIRRQKLVEDTRAAIAAAMEAARPGSTQPEV